MFYYIRSLLRLESGQDLVEYALLAGFISISTVVTLRLIGPLVIALWDVIQTAIASV
jgi:Flp pilus assembly pilin Flp